MPQTRVQILTLSELCSPTIAVFFNLSMAAAPIATNFLANSGRASRAGGRSQPPSGAGERLNGAR